MALLKQVRTTAPLVRVPPALVHLKGTDKEMRGCLFQKDLVKDLSAAHLSPRIKIYPKVEII